jgi:glycerol-3-phosphate cytidylyltransferase
MLLALRCVDIALPYHELDYISVCKKVKADIFVIGEDWGKKPHNKGVEDYLKAQGKKVVQVQYNPRNSSTKIKKDVLSLHQTGKRV